MIGSSHRWLILASMAGLGCQAASAARGDDPRPGPPGDEAKVKVAPEYYGLPGEDPPRAFIPDHPRSVVERKRIDTLQSYAAARAEEDQRNLFEATRWLEKSLESDPDFTPALRRLCRIEFATGREAEAVAHARKIVDAEPGDMDTLGLLVDHERGKPAAVEALLKKALANPKLDRGSIGALYIEYELGNLYESTLRFDRAADEFAKVVEALDDKTNARLAPSDSRRFLGNDEAQAYLRFGRVFLQAKKYELAIRSFRRGLVYEENEPLLLLYLSQAHQAAGQHEEALASIEKFLKRQPQGGAAYNLLIAILNDLKREKEIIPRLLRYAELDPKNVPLRYALADQYKATGQLDKAQALYNALLAEQKDTQNFAETFPRLVRDRKTEELLTLLVKVAGRMRRLDPIRGQVEDLLKDSAYSDEVIDTGIKMISAEPPTLDPQDGWVVLVNLATDAKRPAKLIDLLKWSIARVPNPIAYRELIFSQYDLGRYADAESTVRELIDRFPNERNARNLILLAQIQAKAEKFDDATATVRDALKLEPGDPDASRTLAILLNQAGKPDEAIATVREVLNADPNNPELTGLLASFLTQAGKDEEAVNLFKALIEKNQHNEELVKLARSTLSTIYTNMGDFAKGEAELEAVFAKSPDDAGINNDLGYLYADQGKNLEKAEQMIRKAVDEDPDNGAYLDSLGWVLFKRGKADEARIPLEKAASDPKSEDPTIQDHLGDVYLQLRETGKAKSAWERAARLAGQARPPDRRLPEIRKKLQSLQQFESVPRPAKGNTP